MAQDLRMCLDALLIQSAEVLLTVGVGWRTSGQLDAGDEKAMIWTGKETLKDASSIADSFLFIVAETRAGLARLSDTLIHRLAEADTLGAWVTSAREGLGKMTMK